MNRAVQVWLTVFVFIAIGMIIWYVTQPVVQIVADSMHNAAIDMGTNTTIVERGMTIIEYINVLWIAVYIIAWLLFGFLFGSRKEGVGQYTPTYY